MNDQDVIDRLRGALDEVVGTTTDVELTRPDAGRRFNLSGWTLGAAAASVALVAAGVLVVAVSNSDTDPAPGGPTSVPQSDPSVSPMTSPDTTAPPSVGDGMPWYELALPGVTPGRVVPQGPRADGDQPLRIAWTAPGGAQDGLVTLEILASLPYTDPQGDDALTPIDDTPEGTAWLMRDSHARGESPPSDWVGFWWRRGNDEVWNFSSYGYTERALETIARQASSGLGCRPSGDRRSRSRAGRLRDGRRHVPEIRHRWQHG